ncbi:hypothetical protein EF910_32040 [Streptomyces sp. WAC07149]|uniref:hypothetical protein n=1 Tax=Streptomyces sp. WAC07149 TaxID=2487425 RepID=UPI000F7A5E5B|nr:hypothetical protein [Streptomyces sp. WAC07149]RST00368.1 hypothetical protein EF910_32040 [Streptomyces sp. WAC07149]
MSFLDIFRREPDPDELIDLSTPAARDAYAELLAQDEEQQPRRFVEFHGREEEPPRFRPRKPWPAAPIAVVRKSDGARWDG